MPINSREKGKRGERAFRDVLREAGFRKAFRTVQYSGRGPDASDVTCPELPSIHWEIKNCEAGNPYVWLAQAERDAGVVMTQGEALALRDPQRRIPVVAHKRNGRPWLAVLSMDDLLQLLKETDRVL